MSDQAHQGSVNQSLADLFSNDESQPPATDIELARVTAMMASHKLTREEAWALIRADTNSQLGMHEKPKPAPKAAQNTTPEVSIDDDLLPPELKAMGVLAALEKGLISIEGEHPLAAQLREHRNDPVRIMQLIKAYNTSNAVTQSIPRGRQIPLEIPNHGDKRRVVSNDLARVSLFHVGGNKSARRVCNNELMGGAGWNQEVRYHGIELRQSDEDVFRQLIHEASRRFPGEWIDIDHCEFVRNAKGTPRRLSGPERTALRQVLMNLRAGVLFVKNKKRGSFVTLNLLTGLEGDEKHMRVQFDPRLVILFDAYAVLDYETTMALSGVALKLYTYLSSLPAAHDLYPVRITTLFELCYGTMESQKNGFKAETEELREAAVRKKLSEFSKTSLPKALDSLVERGILSDYDIKGKPRDRMVEFSRPVTKLLPT